MRLYAALYERQSDADISAGTRPDIIEFFTNPEEMGIRCSLPGWVKRIEVTVKAVSPFDKYRRYKDHLDTRLVVLDTLLDRPVASGWVKEIILGSNTVTYIAGGPWKEHERDLDVTNYNSTDTITAVITDILDDHVSRVSSDRTNIATNTTQVGVDWDPNDTGGQYPQELIEELLEMSDASGNVYDYYCVEQPLIFGGVQLTLPYYKARVDDADADFIIQRVDLTVGGLELARHIWDYADEVQVYYGGGGSSSTTSSTTSKYGSRHVLVVREKFSATEADQLELQYVNTFEDAVQQQAFTISSPRITDGAGAKVPLWEMIKRGPGYVRVSVNPELSLYTASRDRAQTFFTSAVDYDYRSNTLRIVPERPDSRLDAVMARSRVVAEIKGEGVNRGKDPRLIGPPVGGGVARPTPQGQR